jgi:SAM-dependent methyltransferase
MSDMHARLLGSYPRTRPALPERWREIYERVYRSSRNGEGLLYGLTQRLESWMHRQIAAESCPDECLLEIGAGTLNHLRWERAWRRYDVVEPFSVLYRNQAAVGLVDEFFADIAEVPAERIYDRIISIATLEHLVDLPAVVARAALHLKPGGRFSAAIPAEGGFLWGLAWRVSLGAQFRMRTGLNYGDLMRHEHVNTDQEILLILRHFFGQVRVRRFPIPWRHGSLYAHVSCGDPDWDGCRQHLSSPRRASSSADGTDVRRPSTTVA